MLGTVRPDDGHGLEAGLAGQLPAGVHDRGPWPGVLVAEQMPAVRLGAGGLADVTISYAAAMGIRYPAETACAAPPPPTRDGPVLAQARAAHRGPPMRAEDYVQDGSTSCGPSCPVATRSRTSR